MGGSISCLPWLTSVPPGHTDEGQEAVGKVAQRGPGWKEAADVEPMAQARAGGSSGCVGALSPRQRCLGGEEMRYPGLEERISPMDNVMPRMWL